MTSTYVVQARMRSTRFPGKVLADLAGQPLLSFMLQRLAALENGRLVVATSEAPEDDVIADLVTSLNAPIVRGSETDVLDRYLQALEAFPADVVVRLTADCPLVDPVVVSRAVELQQRTGADYVSNTLVRTYPDGLDVEVMTADALQEAAAHATDPVEREHVTPFIYRRPERFRLVALRDEQLLGDERWTVDTAADLRVVRRIVHHFAPATSFGWLEASRVIGRQNTPGPGVLHLRPATLDDATAIRSWRNDPVTVKFSKSGAPVPADEHDRWIRDVIGRPGTRIWIAEVDSQPVGQVRIDVYAAVGTVSIHIASEERGKGYGPRALLRLQQVLHADYQVCRLRADVHRDNSAALGAFRRASFATAGRHGDFARLIWER